MQKFGCTFTESVVNLCSDMQLQKNHSRNEARATQRKVNIKIGDKENSVLKAIATRQIASVSTYLKQRKKQYFEMPKQAGKVCSLYIGLNWKINT